MKNLIILSIFCCIFSFACISPVLGAKSNLDEQSENLTQNYEDLTKTTEDILRKVSYSYVSEKNLRTIQKTIGVVDKVYVALQRKEVAVVEKLKELNRFYTTSSELQTVQEFFQNSNYFVQEVFVYEGYDEKKMEEVLNILTKHS